MKLRYEEIKLIIETFNDYNKTINDEWNDSLNIEQEALLNKLQEAINYSRCCETLKDKKEPTFDEMIKEKYIRINDNLYQNRNYHYRKTKAELIEMYNAIGKLL